MKNKFILIIILTLFNITLLADNIEIKSKSISLDKNRNISIFKR